MTFETGNTGTKHSNKIEALKDYFKTLGNIDGEFVQRYLGGDDELNRILQTFERVKEKLSSEIKDKGKELSKIYEELFGIDNYPFRVVKQEFSVEELKKNPDSFRVLPLSIPFIKFDKENNKWIVVYHGITHSAIEQYSSKFVFPSEEEIFGLEKNIRTPIKRLFETYERGFNPAEELFELNTFHNRELSKNITITETAKKLRTSSGEEIKIGLPYWDKEKASYRGLGKDVFLPTIDKRFQNWLTEHLRKFFIDSDTNNDSFEIINLGQNSQNIFSSVEELANFTTENAFYLVPTYESNKFIAVPDSIVESPNLFSIELEMDIDPEHQLMEFGEIKEFYDFDGAISFAQEIFINGDDNGEKRKVLEGRIFSILQGGEKFYPDTSLDEPTGYEFVIGGHLLSNLLFKSNAFLDIGRRTDFIDKDSIENPKNYYGMHISISLPDTIVSSVLYGYLHNYGVLLDLVSRKTERLGHTINLSYNSFEDFLSGARGIFRFLNSTGTTPETLNEVLRSGKEKQSIKSLNRLEIRFPMMSYENDYVINHLLIIAKFQQDLHSLNLTKEFLALTGYDKMKTRLIDVLLTKKASNWSDIRGEDKSPRKAAELQIESRKKLIEDYPTNFDFIVSELLGFNKASEQRIIRSLFEKHCMNKDKLKEVEKRKLGGDNPISRLLSRLRSIFD